MCPVYEFGGTAVFPRSPLGTPATCAGKRSFSFSLTVLWSRLFTADPPGTFISYRLAYSWSLIGRRGSLLICAGKRFPRFFISAALRQTSGMVPVRHSKR